LEIAKRLIELGSEFDCLDEDGFTPFHYVADAGRGRIIPMLLKSGANPGLRDGITERTAYQLAITYHIREIIIVYSSPS
jgi:ankyrin repeat protein